MHLPESNLPTYIGSRATVLTDGLEYLDGNCEECVEGQR